MANLELYITLFAVIGNIFLGLFTYAKNPKSATNRLFFLFIGVFSTYLIANYFALRQVNDADTFILIKVVIILAVVINQAFFLFAAAFPQNKLGINRNILTGSIVFTSVLIPTVLFDFVFVGVVPATSQPIPGPGLMLFLSHTVFLLGGGCSYHKKSTNYTGIQKTQIRYFLFGTVVMFVMIGITNILLVVLFQTTSLVGLLPLYSLIFAGFISYTIIKHRFLDIQMVVARTVAYFLLIFVVGILFSAAAYSVTSIIFGNEIDVRNLLVFVGVVVFIILTRDPILRVVERITDKIFYRRGYSSSVFLGEMSKIMSTSILIDVLSQSLLSKINEMLKSSFSGIYLFKNNNVGWKIEVGQDDGKKESRTSRIIDVANTMNSRLISTLIFDELEESGLKSQLRESGISIAMNLKVKNELIGAMILGEKESGNLYTIQDIGVLRIIAPEVAVAINNSLAYEEIRKFNVTLRDEVVRATNDLRQANEKLKELDKLKDEFVSLASHELRTPMTVIKSYLWLMIQGKTGELTDKQKEYLNRTYASTIRLIDMVNDMLNISRIESGRFTIEPTKMSMSTLASEVISEMQPRAQEQGIHLILDTSQKIYECFADPERIKQVLINLIGNSLKFTPRDGTITVSLEEKDGAVTTHVKDSGCGIKAEDMEKLFKKFNMLGGNYMTKQTGQGTGLGLYLSKSLVELHKGRIWVESEGQNKGSVFSFTLPVVSNAVQAVSNYISSPGVIDLGVEKGRALPHSQGLQG